MLNSPAAFAHAFFPHGMNRSDPIARAIPSVDKLLSALSAEIERFGRSLVAEQVRALLEAIRSGSQPELFAAGAFDHERFVLLLNERLSRLCAPSQRRVLNLTGTVLHTNLGRA